MQKCAVVSFHASYEHICQPVLPKLIYGLVACGFERDAMLHAIGHDAVHGAKQTIEKTCYPKMLLGIFQRPVAQAVGPQMLICLPVVGKQGRHLLCCHKVLIAFPVLCRYLLAAIKLPGQIVHVHSCHFRSQGVGHRLEEWGRDRLSVRLAEHYLGVC